ncbi:ParB/RepB/Spo0J family partition protein [Lysinibacillus endophyticus]|uniref:ParB/RepB/Spo0J family partition protein n=1 Tax=Ureibacillus endophyticus TaxID=1978490 RepID=A0A494Z1S4_9BACL|nr:ParB/RepB/Spo0J family partition protein [Lysinibacillus endophyticus]MCP1146618.1 ParB/RepB/Spo0J family partition protein [Lysinibacillus endophyticus]RKQ16474.1 ParB/RepB/Spo0J family partition protein [Lysinibacillus endophyticus]
MARGLGKGIGALFPTETLETLETVQNEDAIEKISLQKLVVNPFQPRKTFDDEKIDELAQSIKEHGIIQPIVVRKKGKKFEIVVGERRFRAAKLANLEEIPAIIREMTEEQMMEVAILENLQREDLTPIEEAEAYQSLIEKLNFTQEELAKRLGKSRPYITNHMRLLQLPDEVRELVNNGKLTMGHGRTLLGLKNKRRIPEVAEKVVKHELNVRQLEALIKQLNEDVSRETEKPVKKDIFVQATETQLREYFGTNVQIKKSKNKGKIEIEFYSEDDLERILEILQVEQE